MDIIKECAGAYHIGITGHIRPDGDCIGSCLGLASYLKNALPAVYGAEQEYCIRVYLEEAPEAFEVLEGYENIVLDYPAAELDVLFILDTAPDRTGQAQKYYESTKKIINIDHHISNTGAVASEGVEQLNYIRPAVGSCSEVLYDLLDKKYLNQAIAQSIYVGMICDTGVFQYSNTTGETLAKAGELISYGFPFHEIIQKTFYEKTYVQAQIMGRVLLESIRLMNGKIAVGVLDRKTQAFYNVSSKDFEGIVNQLRNIKGVSCAIFMYEIDTLEYKVSLRTDETVDAQYVCGQFGGGGHYRAAGCTMKGTFHDCVNNLTYYIEKQILEAQPMEQ